MAEHRREGGWLTGVGRSGLGYALENIGLDVLRVRVHSMGFVQAR